MKILTQYQFTIICALIFCFIVSLGGCYSMQPEIIDAEYITNQNDYEILSLTLKDRSRIVKDQLNYINFIKGVSDSAGKFVHSVYNNKYKTSVTTDTVPLYRVYKVEIGISQFDATVVVAITTLVILGTFFIFSIGYSSNSKITGP